MRIDNWFDHKWLEFSGKILGAMGFWSKQLWIPPFIPGRVCWQRRYKIQSSHDAYEMTDPGPVIHLDHGKPRGRVDKRKRLVADVAPKTGLMWFSSKSEETGHGAVMVYIPLPEGYWTWYAGFKKKDSWQIGRLKGISRSELEHFMERADPALAGP